MAIQNKLAGGISNVLADVDANNNLKVTLPQELEQSGYDRNMSEVDAGGILGTPKLLAGEVSEDYRYLQELAQHVQLIYIFMVLC